MAEESLFTLPPGRYPGLWRSEWASNITIRLVDDDKHDKTFPREHEVVLMEIPAHDKVLIEGSEYFRGLLSTGFEMHANSVAKPGVPVNDEDCACSLHEQLPKENETQDFHASRAVPSHSATGCHGSCSRAVAVEHGVSIAQSNLATTTQDDRVQPGQQRGGQAKAPHPPPVSTQPVIKHLTDQGCIDVACMPEDAKVMESVLEFMYTHSLPKGASPNRLAKIVGAADYLGSELCVKACAYAMCFIPLEQFTAADIHIALTALQRTLPDSPLLIAAKVTCAGALRQLLIDGKAPLGDEKQAAAFRAALLAVFGDIVPIITNRALLQEFCRLPLEVIEIWGSMDELAVDSENSIAILLSHWWQHTHGTTQLAFSNPTTTATTLSSLLRLPLLSPSFLMYGLDALPWFVQPPQTHHVFKLACIQLQQAPAGTFDLSDRDSFGGLTITPRQQSSLPHLKLQWSITLQQMQQCADTGLTLDGPCDYWQGHMWGLRLGWHEEASDSGPRHPRLALHVYMENAIMGIKPNCQLYAFPRITINSRVWSADWKPGLFSAGQSWYGFVRCSSKDIASELQGELKDGCVDVRVEVSNVR